MEVIPSIQQQRLPYFEQFNIDLMHKHLLASMPKIDVNCNIRKMLGAV
jgi:hypothetical protein